jgi:hypothetical protein
MSEHRTPTPYDIFTEVDLATDTTIMRDIQTGLEIILEDARTADQEEREAHTAQGISLIKYLVARPNPEKVELHVQDLISQITAARDVLRLATPEELFVVHRGEPRLLDPTVAAGMANLANATIEPVLSALAIHQFTVIGVDLFGSISMGLAEPGVSDIDFNIAAWDQKTAIQIARVFNAPHTREFLQKYIAGITNVPSPLSDYFTFLDFHIHPPTSPIFQMLRLPSPVHRVQIPL